MVEPEIKSVHQSLDDQKQYSRSNFICWSPFMNFFVMVLCLFKAQFGASQSPGGSACWVVQAVVDWQVVEEDVISLFSSFIEFILGSCDLCVEVCSGKHAYFQK